MGLGQNSLFRLREQNASSDGVRSEQPLRRRSFAPLRFLALLEISKELERASPKLGMRYRAIDDSEALSALGVDSATAQNEIERFLKPDEARQSCATSPCGEDPEVDLGEADLKTWMIRAHTRVARECNLGSPPETNAADGRDHGKRQGFDTVHDRLARAHGLGSDLTLGDSLKLGHISTGEEHPVLGRRDDGPPQPRTRFDLRKNRLQALHHRSRQFVHLFSR